MAAGRLGRPSAVRGRAGLLLAAERSHATLLELQSMLGAEGPATRGRSNSGLTSANQLPLRSPWRQVISG